jgi:hypothetical protein
MTKRFRISICAGFSLTVPMDAMGFIFNRDPVSQAGCTGSIALSRL